MIIMTGIQIDGISQRYLTVAKDNALRGSAKSRLAQRQSQTECSVDLRKVVHGEG